METVKSHNDNLSNGELFVLQKIEEISDEVLLKLKHYNLILPELPDNYHNQILDEIYPQVPDQIINETKLSRKEKGHFIIDMLKQFFKEKLEMEIALSNSLPSSHKHNLIPVSRKIINDINTSPLAESVQNLAWNYD